MTTRYVPYDFSTVQGAIDASDPGDLIIINYYFEQRQFSTVTIDNLTFSSTAGYGHLLRLDGVVTKVTLAGVLAFSVEGTASNETIIGSDGGNTILGGLGSDTIDGGGGGDLLTLTKGGTDTLNGGDGDDQFRIVHSVVAGNVAVDGGSGNDVVESNNLLNCTFSNVEVLRMAGNVTATMAQIEQFSSIVGSNTLYLKGAGGALDLSQKLTSGNSAPKIDASGLTSAATITGSAKTEIFYDSDHGDRFVGGGGSDYYIVSSASTRVIEAVGGGSDSITASVSYALAAGQEVELLATDNQASTAAINLTGNSFAQTIRGNAGANFLDGSGGVDLLFGYGGDDVYYVDVAGDKVHEAAGGGTDAVRASASYTLEGRVEIELLATRGYATTADIDLFGNSYAQTLQGNAGDNALDGRSGVDLLYGFDGDDRYYVEIAGDRVFEAAGAGNDLLRTSVTYALAAGQEIELLATRGTATTNITDLTGNAFAQTIQGNAVTNKLDGRGGSDTLSGFDGRDAFVFSTSLNSGNRDSITDFSHLDDRFELSSSIFSGLPSGRIASTAFKDLGDRGAKVDSSDRVIYDHDTGVVSFDRDGSGTRYAAVEFAVLSNKPIDVDYTDFTVFA